MPQRRGYMEKGVERISSAFYEPHIWRYVKRGSEVEMRTVSRQCRRHVVRRNVAVRRRGRASPRRAANGYASRRYVVLLPRVLPRRPVRQSRLALTKRHKRCHLCKHVSAITLYMGFTMNMSRPLSVATLGER